MYVQDKGFAYGHQMNEIANIFLIYAHMLQYTFLFCKYPKILLKSDNISYFLFFLFLKGAFRELFTLLFASLSINKYSNHRRQISKSAKIIGKQYIFYSVKKFFRRDLNRIRHIFFCDGILDITLIKMTKDLDNQQYIEIKVNAKHQLESVHLLSNQALALTQYFALAQDPTEELLIADRLMLRSFQDLAIIGGFVVSNSKLAIICRKLKVIDYDELTKFQQNVGLQVFQD